MERYCRSTHLYAIQYQSGISKLLVNIITILKMLPVILDHGRKQILDQVLASRSYRVINAVSVLKQHLLSTALSMVTNTQFSVKA